MGTASSSTASQISWAEDICPEVLFEILYRVPDNDLINNCKLVCKYWKSLIDGHSIWKAKAKQRKCHIPKCLSSMEVLPSHIYRNIAINNPFGRNLIKNPYGKGQLQGWMMSRERRHGTQDGGWAIEDPPKGADSLDTVPELNGHSSCFATTYYLCQKRQCVDLYKEGCSKAIMAALNPEIYVCEWYAARFDCGSVYKLTVLLTDEAGHELDRFEFEYTEPQWTGSKWTKVEHTFPAQPTVRFVTFQHQGQDTQFWAGHYGSKMTGSNVKLILPE